MNRYVCDSRYTVEMVEKLNYGPRHEEPERYKKQLKDIIKNYDKYEAFAKDASEYTKHRYSWENICSEHKQAFEDVLSEQRVKQ